MLWARLLAYVSGTVDQELLCETNIWQRLCQEDEKSSCCTKDEGRPFGAAL
jgi:hypothetical protein